MFIWSFTVHYVYISTHIYSKLFAGRIETSRHDDDDGEDCGVDDDDDDEYYYGKNWTEFAIKVV